MANELLVEVAKILVSAIVGGGATYYWKYTLPQQQSQKQLVERLESELLFAAHGLQKRFYNFLVLGGWVYIDFEDPKFDLIPSPIYRIGQYLAYAEIWRHNREVLRKIRGKRADAVLDKIDLKMFDPSKLSGLKNASCSKAAHVLGVK